MALVTVALVTWGGDSTGNGFDGMALVTVALVTG